MTSRWLNGGARAFWCEFDKKVIWMLWRIWSCPWYLKFPEGNMLEKINKIQNGIYYRYLNIICRLEHINLHNHSIILTFLPSKNKFLTCDNVMHLRHGRKFSWPIFYKNPDAFCEYNFPYMVDNYFTKYSESIIQCLPALFLFVNSKYYFNLYSNAQATLDYRTEKYLEYQAFISCLKICDYIFKVQLTAFF